MASFLSFDTILNMTTRKFYSKQELFALPDDEFIAAIDSGQQDPRQDISDHEDFLKNIHSRINHDDRARSRRRFLNSVKPRNDKILALLDNFLLLEDEVLEMNIRIVDILAYARSYVVDEQSINAVRYSYWDALSGAPQVNSSGDSQKEGSTVNFIVGTTTDETRLPLNFGPGFDRVETILLVKALNEEAPRLLDELSQLYEELRTATMDGGMWTVFEIASHVMDSITFMYFAICNVRASAKLASILDATKGKEAQVASGHEMFCKYIEGLKKQGLKDIRTVCGYPKYSKDPKWLSTAGRSELQDVKVQQRLDFVFGKEWLQEVGLWFGEGYKIGDYVEYEPQPSILARQILAGIIQGIGGGIQENDIASGVRTTRLGPVTLTTNSPAYARWFEELQQNYNEISDVDSSKSQQPQGTPAKKEKKIKWHKKLKQRLLKRLH